ncbi:quinolinate synthase NadA [Dendrosporobacter sp. 1207_IL3150]|uniref:quinolinate synthase NadA n=1 Tax=Dendrosporobacter sp. 1207_IL3150 TaxID=3084054 RepID=UPI002FDA4E96
MTDLKAEIMRLKKERNAIILAHNYQLDEVQEVADYVGDSFYLSKVAAEIDCEVIVFSGVRFMAETAKILSPEKIVLLPEIDAGCPLADMITDEDVRNIKNQHPGVPVVCYINSSTEVKAESDVCCTSSNAVKVISSLPGRKVIFVPDGHLGDYVAKQLPDKELILWAGCCVTHAKVKPEDVLKAKDKYPGAKVLIHPECSPSVVEQADFVGSTSEIIRYAEKSDAKVFIIGTEVGVLCNLRASQPDKQFFLLHPGLVCPNMKKTRLQSVYEALAKNQYEIQVDVDLAAGARRSLTRMLELAQ